jgi:protein-arginine kinase activator protein McsA
MYALSSNYTSGSGSGTAHNSSSFVSRREVRANNATGALPPLGSIGTERSHTGPFDFEQMLQSLHDLFEQDRQIASQQDSTRCGICYLYYPLNQLHYREEGLYMCEQCEQALGHQSMPVVRKQQKL